MEINIGFSYPKTFKIGAKAISLYLNRPYSHVLIYWHSKSLDRTLVYQASHGKVHFIEMTNFLKENDIVKTYKYDICQEKFNKLVQKCVDLAAQPYATTELLTLFLHDMLLKCGIKVDFGDKRGFICSELLANLLEDVFNIKFNKPKYYVNPKDIDNYLDMLIF